jgi:hypothetical protein
LVEAELFSRIGKANLAFALATHAEELLEMLGSVMFLATLLSYAQQRVAEQADRPAAQVLTP